MDETLTISYIQKHQALLRVDGKPFRCECGCNVFTKLPEKKDGELHYRCNGCLLEYTGEK